MTATGLGSTLADSRGTLDKIAGIVIIALGVLFVLTPFVPKLNREWRPDALISRAGSGGPLIAGAAFAFAWTPCIGPTLGRDPHRGLDAGQPGRRRGPALLLLARPEHPVPAHRVRVHARVGGVPLAARPLHRDHGDLRRRADRHGRAAAHRRAHPPQHRGPAGAGLARPQLLRRALTAQSGARRGRYLSHGARLRACSARSWSDAHWSPTPRIRTAASRTSRRRSRSGRGCPAQLWTEDPEHWLTMLHPDDRDAGGGRSTPPIDVEYRMRGKNGWIWVWEREVNRSTEEGTLGICLDITALRATQQALDTAQKQLGAVVNAAPVILFATDAEGTSRSRRARASRRSAGGPGRWSARRSSSSTRDARDRRGRAPRPGRGGVRHHGSIGEMVFDTKWRGLPEGGMIGISIDVTERQRSEERLAHLAYHDALTGLPNRRNVEEQLGRDLARARREDDAVAVLYLDLDHFKLVNDSLGHDAGDNALREAAKRIAGVVRAGDLVARLGGDEFVLVLPGLAPAPTPRPRRRRRPRRCSPRSTCRSASAGEEFQLGASIGIALGPAQGRTPGELLRNADVAMYQAKRAGRSALRRSTAPTTRTTATSSRSPRACAARSPTTSSSCTTSPSTTSRRAACAASRRSCAGATRRGADRARRLHPPRRGDRADHAHRRLGRRGRLRAGARVGRARLRAADLLQRLAARAARRRLRRARRRRARAPRARRRTS